jgi:hypothetical protein
LLLLISLPRQAWHSQACGKAKVPCHAENGGDRLRELGPYFNILEKREVGSLRGLFELSLGDSDKDDWNICGFGIFPS